MTARNPTPSARDDLEGLPWAEGAADPTRNGATGRTCSRHSWVGDSCRRCGHVRDSGRARRGRTARRSGNDAERDLARRLGGVRVGQYGSPVDVDVPGYMVVQSKRGTAFPERIWSWIAALPHDGRLRAVYLSDAPGSGHARRELLCIPLDDFLAWHGPASRSADEVPPRRPPSGVPDLPGGGTPHPEDRP